MSLKFHENVYEIFNLFKNEIKFIFKGVETQLFNYQIISITNDFIFK